MWRITGVLLILFGAGYWLLFAAGEEQSGVQERDPQTQALAVKAEFLPPVVTAQGLAKPAWFNVHLKELLDQYSALYEQDQNMMWQRFELQCKTYADCQGLRDLFTRYLAYKMALVSIDGTSVTNMQQFSDRMDDLLLVREQHFTPAEQEVLFAREQAWDEGALRRLQINQDPTLHKEQKMILIEQQIESLPAQLKASLQPTLQLRKLARVRQQYGPDSSLDYNQLAAEFGSQAADRLLALAEQRSLWQQRLAEYQQQAARLSTQLNGDELLQQIEQLRQTMFSANEQKRLTVHLQALNGQPQDGSGHDN